MSSLLQLIENSNVNDNNVIRNVLKELLFKAYNSRFALLCFALLCLRNLHYTYFYLFFVNYFIIIVCFNFLSIG